MASVAVDKQAPDFTLMDFEGNPFKLSEFVGDKNVLLVLNRGFLWPFCQRHMMQLHHDFEKFVERETIIVVIGPEEAKSFKKYWEKNQLPFYGLPDSDATVLKLYGQQVKIFKLGRLPAQMIIDKKGILRFVHYGHNMEDIPDNEELLLLIEKMAD